MFKKGDKVRVKHCKPGTGIWGPEAWGMKGEVTHLNTDGDLFVKFPFKNISFHAGGGKDPTGQSRWFTPDELENTNHNSNLEQIIIDFNKRKDERYGDE